VTLGWSYCGIFLLPKEKGGPCWN